MKAIALALLLLVSVANPTYVLAANPPKEQLPSNEPILPADAERGPKVIENAHPTKEAPTGATEVKDASPNTVERVDETAGEKYFRMPKSEGKFMVKANKERKTMALALGGGGARGAAHIGVLRVFEQEGIPIDYIVGNSMGAIIGGLYSAGVDLDGLESLGSKGGLRKHYLPNPAMKIITMPSRKLLQPFRKNRLAGIANGKSFEKYLDELIPAECADMSNLKIPFSAVATNLLDGRAYRLSEGKLATAIRASASQPLLLQPVTIGDKIYVDGALRANLPASSARDTGADVVIAVLVDEPLREMKPKDFSTFRGVANRMGDIILAVTDEHQLQFADVIVNPDVSNITVLSDKPEDVMRAIRAGEAAARLAIPAIRKKMGLPEGAQLVQAKPAVAE